jgi:predicted metal-dependent hydrolase
MSNVEWIETAVGGARLLRSARRTLAISVCPDGSVELVAPDESKIEDILKKVARRTNWIRRQQRLFLTLNVKRMPKRYESGATHRYLGRQYRIRVTKGTKPGVRLVGGFFQVTASRGDASEVQELLDEWIRERATEQFRRRVERWKEWCEEQGLPHPRMMLRAMAKRWGSTHKDGRIVLNPKLVQAPSVCIDYVVTHEICHLKHQNHGAEFFRMLSYFMPDWQKVKLRLEQAEI